MSEITPLQKMGAYRGNPYAQETNVVKLEKCDECGDLEICQDLIDAEAVADKALEFVESMTYNGVVYTPYAPINVEDTAAIEAFMTSFLDDVEINIYAKATWVDGADPAGTISIAHIGEGSLTNVAFTVLGDTAPVRCCEFANLIVWNLSAVDDIGPMKYKNEAPEALANTPYAFTGVPATDEATRAQLESDLAAALDNFTIVYDRVEVTIDNVAEMYVMKYFSTDRDAVRNNNTPFAFCEFSPEFNCP